MNKNFWTQRVKDYGHTGWSDNITYLYDQYLRLHLIEKVVNKYFVSNQIKYSLDYGCGSGDFTKLLAQYSEKTLGVDIAQEIIDVASKKNREENITFMQLDNLDYSPSKYSLVNSITVLQHILKDDELNIVLNKLNTILSKKGIFIIVDSYGENQESEYMKLRKYEDFILLLKQNNFNVLETHNLYHPQEEPTKLFKLYSRSIVIRILNRLKFVKVLASIAKFISSYDSPLVISNATTKLTVAQKAV